MGKSETWPDWSNMQSKQLQGSADDAVGALIFHWCEMFKP